MKRPEPRSQVTWGITRYAAGSGPGPEDDAVDFDGWYIDLELALAIAQSWAARYPEWFVALVRYDSRSKVIVALPGLGPSEATR
jgi:hypothetical protein